MPDHSKEGAADLLKSYRVDGSALYVVGTFDTGVTVFSQQIRALNLVWAAIESELLPATASPDDCAAAPIRKVAIVGAGFAGLTVAAALMAKGARADITLFEQRDTLLPLQQGSDSRWLHPRIYDWPMRGSQSSVAMLPILNWTAARASDVVVQVLAQWGKLPHSTAPGTKLYCNARHLQIHETGATDGRLRIEWVGDRRNPEDGTTVAGLANAATGGSDDFDIVIVAIGFGLERDGALSYWRNETIGQPSLEQPRRTFLVSGQGDGAMIDLLRIRVSQYRQDRILDELFTGRGQLLRAIETLHREHADAPHKSGLFADLENLASDESTSEEFELVRQDLSRRLRRDTDVILRLHVKKLSQLFDPVTSRISFQNKLLVFFLYKCGGFVPSAQEEEKLVSQHAIQPDRIIRRHGTYRDDQLRDVLSEKLYNAIETRRGRARPDPFSQSDKPRWPGGYFDIPGAIRDIDNVGEAQRSHWRKEYLPGPTQLLTTAFCSALSGVILARHRNAGRLRVTLHRAVVFGTEELLQQTCDYEGTPDARGPKSTAGRTFPAKNGTIGIAYKCRRIVRSAPGVKPSTLNEAMAPLRLHEASRRMSTNVGFVLAIPLIEPEAASKHTAPSPVLGVIYIDSTAPKFFINDEELRLLVSMTESLLDALCRASHMPLDRIRNVHLADLSDVVQRADPLPRKVRGILELVPDVDPPASKLPLQLNYDFAEFLPVHAAGAA